MNSEKTQTPLNKNPDCANGKIDYVNKTWLNKNVKVYSSSCEDYEISEEEGTDEFYCNFKQHQVSSYTHKGKESTGGCKRYYIINREGEMVNVNKKFFDTHKKFVRKIVMEDAVYYYSSGDKVLLEKAKLYEPQSLALFRSMYSSLLDKISLARAISNNVGNPHLNAFIIDFVAILSDMWGYHTMTSWGIILCRIYSLILRYVEFSQFARDTYRPQSNFIDLSLAVAVLGLPRELIEKLRVFQTLATSKMTSSSLIISVLRKFVDILLNFISFFKEKFPGNERVLQVEKIVIENFAFVTYMGEIEEISDIYSKYVKNSQIMLDLKFRETVMSKEAILADIGFMSFLNNPEFKHYKEIVQAFKINILKYAKNYTVSSRTEPVCFILEGPAGCRKSTFMNQLVQLCKRDNRAVYAHIIPSIDAAKDYYDDYENQDVFVTDDIGQQGASQWRTIINFVAPVKMPLDCANAEKKNTKFFNSNLILGTTNLLSGIQTFTSKDCITSKEALFRRIHLIKFAGSGVNFNITYNKFDYQQDLIWKNQFMDNMKGCTLPVQMDVDYTQRDEVRNAIVWMYSLIKYAEQKNVAFSQASTFSDQDLELMLSEVSDKLDDFKDASDGGEANSLTFDDTDLSAAADRYQAQMWKWNLMDSAADLSKNCVKNAEYALDSWRPYVNTFINVGASWANVIGEYLKGRCFEFVNNVKDFVFNSQYSMLLGAVCFICVSVVVINLITTFVAGKDKEEKILEELYNIQSSKGADNLNDNQLRVVRNHLFIVKCTSTVKDSRLEQVAVGFMSGNYLVLNDHLVGTDPVFNIYKDYNALHNNNLMFNNLPFVVVRRFLNEDLCVLYCDKFTVTPIRKYSDHVRLNQNLRDSDKMMYVTNPSFTVPIINKLNAKINNHIVVYNSLENRYMMKAEETFTYDQSAAGLCGSLLIDSNGNPCGHHICGRENEGVIKIWSTEFLNFFIGLSSRDNTITGNLRYEIKHSDKLNYSGLRLFQDDLAVSRGSSKSKIVESDMKDIRSKVSDELENLCKEGIIPPPVEKRPAILDIYGKDTLCKLAEKSLKPIPHIPPEELDFVKKCLKAILPKKFSKISEVEAAFGSKRLPALNKKAANGYGYTNDKNDYFDFETKELKPEMRKKILDFKTAVLNNKVEPTMLLSKEALKDELRPLAKACKPRTFRVMPLHHTFLVKQYLGELFLFLKDRMWENGIAIGLNPYKDFDKLYNMLKTMSVHFDGDFGSYDGSAPSQLQDLIAECVLESFEGTEDDRKILKVLLDSMVRSWVLVREKLILTTHSMPSGCWVTALFNSLLNRCLTALCIKRFSEKPSVFDFLAVLDFVLGDDKVVGAPERLREVVNALNMRKVAESLGMTYTDALKGEIVEPSKKLDECQFLKRNFRYHSGLEKMVGILDMNTLIETLRYFSSDKEYEVVMNGKMTALQFELFLYGDRCFDLKKAIFDEAHMNGLTFQTFSDEVITQTMESDDAYRMVLSSLDKYDFII